MRPVLLPTVMSFFVIASIPSRWHSVPKESRKLKRCGDGKKSEAARFDMELSLSLLLKNTQPSTLLDAILRRTCVYGFLYESKQAYQPQNTTLSSYIFQSIYRLCETAPLPTIKSGSIGETQQVQSPSKNNRPPANCGRPVP